MLIPLCNERWRYVNKVTRFWERGANRTLIGAPRGVQAAAPPPSLAGVVAMAKKEAWARRPIAEAPQPAKALLPGCALTGWRVPWLADTCPVSARGLLTG